MFDLLKKDMFGFKFISSHNYDLILESIFKKDFENCTDEIIPFIITPNVDQIVKFSNPKLKELQQFYQKSAYVFPDGQPIVWSSKILKKPLLSRLTGSDFFPQIWNNIKEQNKRALLVVPSEVIASQLENEYQHCKCFVPPFFKLESEEYDMVRNQLIKLLLDYQPDFFFIGLGFPKQEILGKDLFENLKDQLAHFPLTLLLGASFEFYTGTTKRAPRWMQKIGMEWFYRFLREPKRMFKRYFIDSWYFIYLIFNETRRDKK